MMSGVIIKLRASTKERIDKLQASLQDYLCKVMGKCPPAGVPKTVIIDTLVKFCLNKDLDILFRGASIWLEKKGNNTKERLVSVRISDETKEELDQLRGRIIEAFLNKAQELGLYDFQPDDLRESLRALLSYSNLFDIILAIFKPEVFTEEVTNAINKGSKVSPAYYRFINMVVEKTGSAIATSDPYTRVMSFLKKVEDEEAKRRRAEALNRRAMELLQQLEGKPIRTTLRIGREGWNYLAVPKDVDVLRSLSIILHANVVGQDSRLVADVEFTLGDRTFHLKDLWIFEFASTDVKHLIPPGWWSGGLPLIIIGTERELPPDLTSVLKQVTNLPIDVDATIRIHRIKEVH